MENGRNSTKVYARMWIETDAPATVEWRQESYFRRGLSGWMAAVRRWFRPRASVEAVRADHPELN